MKKIKINNVNLYSQELHTYEIEDIIEILRLHYKANLFDRGNPWINVYLYGNDVITSCDYYSENQASMGANNSYYKHYGYGISAGKIGNAEENNAEWIGSLNRNNGIFKSVRTPS